MFHLYGLFVGLAVVVWWSMVEYLEPKLNKQILPTLILALIGARLYHVLDYSSYYLADWRRVGEVWNGGMSIWGALILGGGYLLIVARESLWAAVTALPLAQALGRIANGVNGEFTNKVIGIPWWRIEALLDLSLFVLIWYLPRKYRVGVYLLSYLLIRLVLKPYRE